MIEVSMSKISKSYGFNIVLDNFDLELKTGERVGLIGQNGCGKSTVFKIITGEENYNSGEISTRRGATIGYFNQMPLVVGDDTTIKDVLSKGVQQIYSMEKGLRDLELQMSSTEDPDKLDILMKRYGNLSIRYEECGGYEVEATIAKICEDFNIDRSRLDDHFNNLSGGEKAIVTLASLMISNPSILLLDEPTNHLDISALEWFENFLINYSGTVLVVSHDQYFLDRVVNRIVLIQRGKADNYVGNYSAYVEENEKRITLEFEAYKDQQKMIQAMKKSIKKLYEFGRLATPGGEAFFKRAASIQKRLDKLEILDKPQTDLNIPLSFDIERRSGKDALVVKNLDVLVGERILFENASFLIRYGEKVCLIGDNGSGKSTLIKTILNAREAFGGEIKIGYSVKIGYIPQEIVFDNEDKTVLEVARESFDGNETHLRASLNRFLFCEDGVFKKVGFLSGGEKVRLKLFSLIQQKANFIILDEPTNHIDINTKEILEEALEDFKGTLLFVSHDRFFINKLAKRTLAIEHERISSYIGNYDFYKTHRRF